MWCSMSRLVRPFLNEKTLLFTNAKQGFNQSFSYPNPSAFAYDWPTGIVDTTTMRQVDMSRSDHEDSYVSTHVFDQKEKYGYVIAYDPESQVAIGYVWLLSEYPWINIWHQLVKGKLWAKGLEFGTTGIGRPYEELLAGDTRFHGYNSFEYIDAGEEKIKSFQTFMLKITDLKHSEIIISKSTIQFRNITFQNLLSD